MTSFHVEVAGERDAAHDERPHDPRTDVTHDDPIATGKIALARDD
jgi:hypothetical protein